MRLAPVIGIFCSDGVFNENITKYKSSFRETPMQKSA